MKHYLGASEYDVSLVGQHAHLPKAKPWKPKRDQLHEDW